MMKKLYYQYDIACQVKSKLKPEKFSSFLFPQTLTLRSLVIE